MPITEGWKQEVGDEGEDHSIAAVWRVARGRTGYGRDRRGGHRDVAELEAARDGEAPAAHDHVQEPDRAHHQVFVLVHARRLRAAHSKGWAQAAGEDGHP